MKRKIIMVLAAGFIFGCSGGADTIKTGKPGSDPLHSRSHAAEPAAGSRTNCYTYGYQWGICTARNTAGQACDPKKDAIIPDQCLNQPDTQQGIKDGLRKAQMHLQ